MYPDMPDHAYRNGNMRHELMEVKMTEIAVSIVINNITHSNSYSAVGILVRCPARMQQTCLWGREKEAYFL
jgi:hypothetical protein